jgi:hypothetical protein
VEAQNALTQRVLAQCDTRDRFRCATFPRFADEPSASLRSRFLSRALTRRARAAAGSA